MKKCIYYNGLQRSPCLSKRFWLTKVDDLAWCQNYNCIVVDSSCGNYCHEFPSPFWNDDTEGVMNCSFRCMQDTYDSGVGFPSEAVRSLWVMEWSRIVLLRIGAQATIPQEHLILIKTKSLRIKSLNTAFTNSIDSFIIFQTLTKLSENIFLMSP